MYKKRGNITLEIVSTFAKRLSEAMADRPLTDLARAIGMSLNKQ